MFSAASFRPAVLPGLLGAALLSGCARTADNFTPRIVVSGSDGGTVSQNAQAAVHGYVLDDVSVTQIKVNDQPVTIEGSHKIANFKFQPDAKNGKAEYTITARDAAGHTSKETVTVVVDTTPPQIQVKSFNRVGNLIRVSGVATDNTRVAQILIDGNRLNITPGQKVEFYAETSGIYADITVLDVAGNKATRRAQ